MSLREMLPFFVLAASIAAIFGGLIVVAAAREFERWWQRLGLWLVAIMLIVMGGSLAIDVGQKMGWLS